MRIDRFITTLLILSLAGCGLETKKDSGKMNNAYSTNLEMFMPLLEENIPAPVAVMWQGQTQNEFFNENKIVAIVTLDEKDALALSEKMTRVNNGDGEYLPEIIMEWFPEEVKANFYQNADDTSGLMTSKVPQFRAADFLKSPYESGPAFIINQYLLIIGQSL